MSVDNRSGRQRDERFALVPQFPRRWGCHFFPQTLQKWRSRCLFSLSSDTTVTKRALGFPHRHTRVHLKTCSFVELRGRPRSHQDFIGGGETLLSLAGRTWVLRGMCSPGLGVSHAQLKARGLRAAGWPVQELGPGPPEVLFLSGR